MFAKDFAGFELDDGDGCFVGDGEDACSGVASADSEVVHAVGASDADVAVVVDSVVSVASAELTCPGFCSNSSTRGPSYAKRASRRFQVACLSPC